MVSPKQSIAQTFDNARVNAYKEHPLRNDDSDDDITVLSTFKSAKSRSEGRRNDFSDSDYVVLSNTNTYEYDYNATFYGVEQDALQLDPSAPYYTESVVNWVLGQSPVNPNGAKVYTIKLQNLMSETVLQQYIDAGVTQLQLQFLKVQLVPQQFTEGTLGASSLKVVQGNYFDTQIAKIQEEFLTEVSEEVTGTTYNIPIDRAPIAQLLQTSIAILTYRWYNVNIISNKPTDGSNIALSMLLTAEIQPGSGNPFRVNSSNDGDKKSAQKKSSSLPAKFL